MVPLYAAVARGCAAGRPQEALEEVYVPRIRRGNTAFNTRVLGAYGAELSVLVKFFEVPWSRAVAGLDEKARSLVFNEAGATLLALGRLTEAVGPLQASLESRVAQADWSDAAVSAWNLSDIYLTSGDLSKSRDYARQGVELAERSGNDFLRSGIRASLADAMHQAGRLSEAESFFREAEAILRECQPQFPKLYSQPGFKYCDFLLGRGEWQEVLSRAEAATNIASSNGWLLDTALGYLSIGQALLFQGRREAEGNLSRATEYLHRTVVGLRQAGVLSFLPLGLLTRAEMFHVKGEFELARADLGEAMSIATRGGMGLLLADCHLARARLFSALGERGKAREHALVSREMIERMGYHRRDEDISELLNVLGE
jgi:tetratricopeptide (TPR) repeat protein